MKSGRPKAPLNISSEERNQLDSLASSRSLSPALVTRARIVWMASDGMANTCIAKKVGLTASTVGKWRTRYIEHGLQGLHDEWRSGRPRSVSDENIIVTKNIFNFYGILMPRFQSPWTFILSWTITRLTNIRK